jgi:hypothetical protein
MEAEGDSPIITVSMSPLHDPESGVDVDAFLDSGTSTSLFNGSFLQGFDIAVINDHPKTFRATSGASLTAYLHAVRLTLPTVGVFDLTVAFSIDPIIRNLLGRDFFNLVQIGFRERHLQYFLQPTP